MEEQDLHNYLMNHSNQYKVNDSLYNFIDENNIYDKEYGRHIYRKVRQKTDPHSHDKIYKKFKLDVTKYKRLLDVCSNPNIHSLYVLKNNPEIVGQGISLPIKKRGPAEHKELAEFKDRFFVQYFDLLVDDLDDIKMKNADHLLTGCFVAFNRPGTLEIRQKQYQVLQNRIIELILNNLDIEVIY